jgi:flagellar FliJ protein
MRPFHFRLNKVQHIRQSVREQRRLELLEAQQAEDHVSSQIADLQSELQSLQSHARFAAAPGRLNIDDLRHTQRFERSLRGELQSAQTRRQALSAEVERRREAVVEADREVKVLDRLEEKQRAQYRIDQARCEARAI